MLIFFFSKNIPPYHGSMGGIFSEQQVSTGCWRLDQFASTLSKIEMFSMSFMIPAAIGTMIDVKIAPNVWGQIVTLAMCINFITGGFFLRAIKRLNAYTIMILMKSTTVTNENIRM